MKFTIYQESRLGKRSNNEDRLAHCYSRDALLAVIADGMGGHHYGEIAAQITVQTLIEAFQQEARPAIDDPFMFLQKSIMNGHRAIRDFSDKHDLKDSPRTTCVACLIQDNIAYWAHAGDSRLYLMRNGRVLCHTRDHSRVQLLLDQGVITVAQAAVHPERNKIYSCLGGPTPPEIEFSRKTPLETGDTLMLCTDGLWGVLSGDVMAVGLKQGNLMQSVPMLLNQADIRGGPNADNLSTVVVRWEDSYIDAHATASSVISTRLMSHDSITTKLDAFGRNPNYKSELSDEEIESAIDEIRSAIQKYAR